MTTRLPMDLPDELPIHGAAAERVAVKPDPDWNARGRRRLRAALEAMAGQSAPISLQTLRESVSESVPLLDYDRSTTKSGSVRAWNDLGWYLTTNYEHSGWLHATSAGYRITDAGRAQLDAGTSSEELFDRRDCHVVESREGVIQIPVAVARKRNLIRCMPCVPTVR